MTDCRYISGIHSAVADPHLQIIGGGEGLSIKNFIQHLGPQFGLKNKAGPCPGSAAVPYLIVYYYMFIDNSFYFT